jgi:Na+/proline symporter
MTGYFSMQMAEIDELYNLKTYWMCFLVVVVASVLGLIAFGLMAKRTEGRMAYKSLTRTFLTSVKKEMGKLS